MTDRKGQRSLLCILLLAAALVATVTAEDQPVTVYVQLIRGTNNDKPDKPDWKPVGPKLSDRLNPVFRWPHYWEVSRQSVLITPNQTARARLTDDRNLELERKGKDLDLRLYRDGKLVRTLRQAMDSRMGIMGGDADGKQCWFIVVRTDKPK